MGNSNFLSDLIVNFTTPAGFLYLLSILVFLLILLYMVFAFIIIRQVYLMTISLTTNYSAPFIFLAYVHFFASVGLAILSFVLLF